MSRVADKAGFKRFIAAKQSGFQSYGEFSCPSLAVTIAYGFASASAIAASIIGAINAYPA